MIASPSFLESLKSISDDLKLQEQGDNYILSYSGNDNKIIKALNAFDKNLYAFRGKEINLKNVNLKIILKKVVVNLLKYHLLPNHFILQVNIKLLVLKQNVHSLILIILK